MYPDFSIKFYNDTDCINYLQENFSNKYLVVDPNHYLSSLHLENNYSYNYKAVGLNI